MIILRQHNYSESDAMTYLYKAILNKTHGDKKAVPVISRDALIPILKGNNVVIERFVINHPFVGKDRYRLYIKIGAKAKLPDEVRLPSTVEEKKLGYFNFRLNNGFFKDEDRGSKKAVPVVSSGSNFDVDIRRSVNKLLGDAIRYDKQERSLVLEFDKVDDAINSLDILPFGLNYKIYLLE